MLTSSSIQGEGGRLKFCYVPIRSQLNLRSYSSCIYKKVKWQNQKRVERKKVHHGLSKFSELENPTLYNTTYILCSRWALSKTQDKSFATNIKSIFHKKKKKKKRYTLNVSNSLIGHMYLVPPNHNLSTKCTFPWGHL